jgi:hypothetical protein
MKNTLDQAFGSADAAARQQLRRGGTTVSVRRPVEEVLL